MPIQDDATNRLVNLENAFGRVFERAMDWAEKDFKEEIEAVKWNWPNDTTRANGSAVGSPRDIVDLGGLRDSQTRENESQYSVDFVWTGGEGRSYALEVHDGYRSKGGQSLPARSFTNGTVSRLNTIVDSLIVEEVRNG